jgi:hypothetical protein
MKLDEINILTTFLYGFGILIFIMLAMMIKNAYDKKREIREFNSKERERESGIKTLKELEKL